MCSHIYLSIAICIWFEIGCKLNEIIILEKIRDTATQKRVTNLEQKKLQDYFEP